MLCSSLLPEPIQSRKQRGVEKPDAECRDHNNQRDTNRNNGQPRKPPVKDVDIPTQDAAYDPSQEMDYANHRHSPNQPDGRGLPVSGSRNEDQSQGDQE